MVNFQSATSRQSVAIELGDPESSGVWPAITNVYQQHGYESGYARGANDALATVLEATEEFARQRPESCAEIRGILLEFSKFLDRRIRTRPSGEDDHFVDGLGI
jgi:hypothetical protein